ncbi:alpha-L-arabinofuranosidase C-terminal domain-containing protein [Chondrinema litorale]|uniref:alpha-L-arabinofuranosidase C-terminal domain-containing protein n=1 Tax=Chondrinema litorale TaxID=2994555 RepID=UPI00254289C3|nr:alpha-L-arabinofuranosidase C-terminal domain-containing protein [Chondrinema litorale]UZR95341.1 hypothetical protein OQ292_05850 [Chondrinema litorale]
MRKNIKITLLLIVLFALTTYNTIAQNKAEITIHFPENDTEISPNIYGQFIEYLRNSITGGIFEEGSSLSDPNGFRKDVLEKIKELNTPVLRYPGGTVTKTYHWEDGIGPRSERPARRNLIWGGVEDNHFGTDEYIKYCHEIGAEPSIVINMGSGTAEEAANWVEYCNGTGNTYYANLRRKNGSEEPYNVKYWSLGNEEAAWEDAGRLSDPAKYAEEAWYFAKLMKLTDPSIKFFVVADPFKQEWNDVVIGSLSPITDYISIHWYVGTIDGKPWSIYNQVDRFENSLIELGTYLEQFPAKVEDFSKWYRFPPRSEAIKISIDEWGIWEGNCGGQYNLDCEYTWRHALATASFLNVFHRQSANVTMANWAQSVNILGAILANKKGSIEQTVFYPLQYFRKYLGTSLLNVETSDIPTLTDDKTISALDISSTFNNSSNEVCVFIVNRSKDAIETKLNIEGVNTSEGKLIQVTALDENAYNVIGEKDIVNISEEAIKLKKGLEVAPLSINILVVKKD